MKLRGFLALFVLIVGFVYLLMVIKAGKEEHVVEEVEALSKAKLELTKVNMATLARMMDSFVAGRGRMPKNLKELQAFLVQPIVKSDAWGTEIKFERLSDENFRLISAGKDRIFNTPDDIVLNY